MKQLWSGHSESEITESKIKPEIRQVVSPATSPITWQAMSVLYHAFRTPLPYSRTLLLQQQIHQIQLATRRIDPTAHKDILLLLQHRPVYTAGRRQTEEEVALERARLTNLGADFVLTQRGGQITYHGPGQIVGYPLMDLGRYQPAMSIRDYICRMQKMMSTVLKDEYGIPSVPSDNTGVFLNDTTKIGSIGVQVRHRLTTHGFAFNVTREPLAWFNQVIACGLADVKAECMENAMGESITVGEVIPPLVETFGRIYGKDMEEMDPDREGEIGELIRELEEEAIVAGEWTKEPVVNTT